MFNLNGARSQRVPNFNKNTSKTDRTLFTFYGTRWATHASISVKHKKVR